jgi:hypothetical protein
MPAAANLHSPVKPWEKIDTWLRHPKKGVID